MVVIVDAGQAEDVTKCLTEQGETVFTIGHIEALSQADDRVVMKNAEALWRR
jgi:phosphoribosylaminoimidazole (AIR) synthetase